MIIHQIGELRGQRLGHTRHRPVGQRDDQRRVPLRIDDVQIRAGREYGEGIARIEAALQTVLAARRDHIGARADLEVVTAELLDRVNRDGTALVIVTHDHTLASRARRVVTLRDGAVESERAQ